MSTTPFDARALVREVRTLRADKLALAERNARLSGEVYRLQTELKMWQGQALSLRRLDEKQPHRRRPENRRLAAMAAE